MRIKELTVSESGRYNLISVRPFASWGISTMASTLPRYNAALASVNDAYSITCKPCSLINDPNIVSDELITPILIPAPLNFMIVSESYKDSIPNNNADEKEAMNNWIRMEIAIVRSRMTEANSF